MKREKETFIANRVLESITGTTKEPTSTKELMLRTGLTLRQLKAVIYQLRKDHPICSRSKDGGGYWIAQTDDEVREFINMLHARVYSSQKTLDYMLNHLDALDEE